MSLKVENIKKFMGWCPNAKTAGAGSRISLDNFEAPTQSGGGKTGSKGTISQFIRQFTRLRNRVLTVSIYLTLLYLALLSRWGINQEAFLEGLGLSLLFTALFWKKQMHYYDTLAKKPVVSSFGKNKLLRIFFAIILLMVSVLVFLPYVVRTIFHNMQTLYSFGAGAIFFMWTSYLQIIYWERKNNMRICTKSEGEFRKTYSREICPEGKRGLE
ncbi:hypothetical protein MSHOH_0129 [Methanosarcina horonobensis HB-1 = JCM 15518]|uniref:DUF1673 domain-containing protein n=1 Tax=Methanosarcina horonobensis HB-1 = JCM 15518 TaxID=1434110 RepID=A0A0E3SAB8_9EURY|nr:DUF1673 family protein [Methanosarcina horonobensis]AKB76612.1 hypothetical protein MSHOH_0129 [Methanosarcina horonobensis HB-1 = JCM 15518]